MSFPSRERGLKPDHKQFYCCPCKSFPSRERGLKPVYVQNKQHEAGESFPSRERGLKLI